jgi:hypothetical protein
MKTGAVVRPAERVSELGHVLAWTQTLGRGWDLGMHLARVPHGTRRAVASRRRPRFIDGTFAPAKKGALTSAPPTGGKVQKCMVPKSRSPRGRSPRRLVGDRGYDSDPLSRAARGAGITLISPHRDNRIDRPYEDRRRPRVYRERWIIEPTLAWFGACGRLLVRSGVRIVCFSRSFNSPQPSSCCGGCETGSSHLLIAVCGLGAA